jgi:glutathione peroxidase-family protein
MEFYKSYKTMEYKDFFNLFEKNVGKNNDQHPLFPMVSTNHRGKGKQILKLFTYKMNKLLMVRIFIIYI